MNKMTIIVGLGNPGNKYLNSRHNVGFSVVDALSDKYGIKVNRLRHRALIGDGNIKGERVLLVKPQTFMNLSGESVRDIVEWYNNPIENTIIIFDDADLPVGTIRIRQRGSAGTHNGMKSVIYQLRSDDFPRIRVGIGNAPENWDMADYVLSRFNDNETEHIKSSIDRAADAAASIVASGVDAAMNMYNGLK